MSIGENIRSIRTAARVSRAMLARQTGLSAQGLWKIESGHTPTIATLNKIATVLGVPPHELLHEPNLKRSASLLAHPGITDLQGNQAFIEVTPPNGDRWVLRLSSSPDKTLAVAMDKSGLKALITELVKYA